MYAELLLIPLTHLRQVIVGFQSGAGNLPQGMVVPGVNRDLIGIDIYPRCTGLEQQDLDAKRRRAIGDTTTLFSMLQDVGTCFDFTPWNSPPSHSSGRFPFTPSSPST